MVVVGIGVGLVVGVVGVGVGVEVGAPQQHVAHHADAPDVARRGVAYRTIHYIIVVLCVHI